MEMFFTDNILELGFDSILKRPLGGINAKA